MSKYSSLFEVQGKIGATTFQKRKGQLIIGKTGGVSKDRIAKASEFKRTRENNREFGGSANAGKSLRVGLANVMKRFADDGVTGRLTAVFRQMTNGASGIRGKRPIEIVPQKAGLIGIDLDAGAQLSTAFVADYLVSVNVGRNEVTVDVPIFSIDDLVTAPEGASHWRLVLAITVLSDHAYDEVKKKYLPVEPGLNGKNAKAESGLIPIEGVMTAPLQLVATLPNSPAMTANCGLIACLGIEFSQEVASLPYVFAQSNAMCIVDVF